MTAPLNTASLVSRLRDIAMGRLKPDNGSSVPLADELRAAADALESTSRALCEKEGENTRLRAALAQSDQPCAYCSLPKDEWSKCASGFPGCDRADDAMGCPELGARLALDEALASLRRLVDAKALRGVREIVAGWNGEGRADGPYPRHDARLGATLPKTNCGAVYELDEAMTEARKVLADATKKDPGTEQREAGV